MSTNKRNGRRWFSIAVLFFAVALLVLLIATLSFTPVVEADPTCDAMPPGLIGYAPSYFGDPKRLDVQGDYAYLVDWHGSIMVFDISDPCNPLPLGSAQDTAQEFQDVVVIGDYAYVANDANGLAVYDISDPNAPFWVTARKDGGGYANSISYDGGQYAFVSQHYAYGYELVIYDMTTFPTSTPTIYSSGPGWPHAWEIHTVGNRAYHTIADGSGGLRFQILDISGLPAVPVLLGSLDLPASSYGDGFKIDVQGDYAYLTAGYSPQHEGSFVIVNISDETDPYVEGEVFIPNAGIVTWRKPGLDIVGDEVYLMEKDGLYGFDVSDKSNPTQFVNFPFPVSFGETAGGDVVIRDGLAFTAVTYPEPGSSGDHGGIAVYRLKPSILMTGNLVGNDLYLVWTNSNDTSYDILRSLYPYNAYEWRASTDQPGYIENEAGVDNISVNYFFEVKGNAQGPVSNQIGVFTFGIVDGN